MATSDLRSAPAISMLAENDLQKGRAFWRDTVGLEEIETSSQDEATFMAGSTVFSLYEHRGGSRADHTQIAFMVEDVRATKDALERKGVKFEEYDIPGVKTINGIADMGEGGEGAWFLDPGGNIVGLFTASRELQDAVTKKLQMSSVGA